MAMSRRSISAPFMAPSGNQINSTVDDLRSMFEDEERRAQNIGMYPDAETIWVEYGRAKVYMKDLARKFLGSAGNVGSLRKALVHRDIHRGPPPSVRTSNCRSSLCGEGVLRTQAPRCRSAPQRTCGVDQ